MDRLDKRLLWILLAGLIAVTAVAAANFLVQPSRTADISYSQLLDLVESDVVARVEIEGGLVLGQRRDGAVFQSYAPDIDGLVEALRRADVDITARAAPPQTSLQQTLIGLLPVVLLTGVMIFFMLRSSGQARRAGGMGKSRARRLDAQVSPIRFTDVAGAVEAKQSLEEIVDFLRRPERYAALGGRIPKGVLMVGPPGNGKTLLARAVAGEAGVPFYAISGSDFVEMFVGVGASRVRDMFEAAKNTAPCIIFIDEIDAVGRHRGAGSAQGNDEREQTLNQLLVEMDGIAGGQGIVVMAATNRPDVLDPALVRSGRFDREVVVDHPDRLARRQILEVHLRSVPLAPGVNLDVIAQATPGLSGADLANLVNEAVLLAVRAGEDEITASAMEKAKDKVMRGDERHGLLASPEERRRAACRAAGASLLAMRLPHADPVEKASIIPRGRSSNHLTQLDPDTGAATSRQLRCRLTLLVAGRAAEQLVFGADDVSTVTADGLAEASRLARSMVMRWGMSDTLGPVVYAGEDDGYLGAAPHSTTALSPDDAGKVSTEVRALVDGALAQALDWLTREREVFEALAQALNDRESLTGAEIAAIAGGQVLPMRLPA